MEAQGLDHLTVLVFFHRPGGGVTNTPPLWSELILVPLLLTLEPWELACLGGSILKYILIQSYLEHQPGRRHLAQQLTTSA